MDGLHPKSANEYHVFICSPEDMAAERQAVRQFFEEYNRHTAHIHGIRFTVIDCENYASAGVGRPQELITQQTLERFHASLAVVIGLMGQQFGSPTGSYASGTEEEFEWALKSFQTHGFPEIKWFFRKVERFLAPEDPDEIEAALAQWKKVRNFKQRLQQGNDAVGQPPLFYKEFAEASHFQEVLRNDLAQWLNALDRPWSPKQAKIPELTTTFQTPSAAYYKALIQDFQWLDIAGIDNDKSFNIPLGEMYVRLRVMLDEEARNQQGEELLESGPIDIQTALERYHYLVIVGDPGSGKSTFLRFIALMIARSRQEHAPGLAYEKLNLAPPLPIPIFISLWDLADFMHSNQRNAHLATLLTFIEQGFQRVDASVSSVQLQQWLEDGYCALLFDGLDEVPTDQGRAVVSRLVEDCVQKYAKNRYVITSSIRAYSGDTVLKGAFVRCDIQQFDATDRAEFLGNWVALLFKKPHDRVSEPGSDSYIEFLKLTTAIEKNERIRLLAVNPLLLTVVAIVHWNRKRLPEQRVELYDECVDVLLGQRKVAEQAQRSRKAEILDESKAIETQDDRAWVRKRFAEIALQILLGEDEEISRQRVIEILRKRFKDRGAANDEQAEQAALHFLDRQELRSGLLVSRRTNSYRFVHLTFQEYLAAWQLAGLEVNEVSNLIQPHLRTQKWFETLQLLGGEWAKRSDENVDRYVTFLLDQQGQTIDDRAPVIALCANVVNDIAGIAEITQNTRKRYEAALTATLQVFSKNSRVAAQTQLEILEALGKLGHVVKNHLVSATKSGHRSVRSRALEMVIPHLPDDDLFGMTHLFNDRSADTIATYFKGLFERDPLRTQQLLVSQATISEKLWTGVINILPSFLGNFTVEVAVGLVTYMSKGTINQPDFMSYPISNLLSSLVRFFPQEPMTWNTVLERVIEDEHRAIRQRALELLAEGRAADEQTWHIIRVWAQENKDKDIRQRALELLAKGRAADEQTWHIIRVWAQEDEDRDIRQYALGLLVAGRAANKQTWQFIRVRAQEDNDRYVRRRALELLAAGRAADEQTWQFIRVRAQEDEDEHVRRCALELLAAGRAADEQTWQFIRVRAQEDEDRDVRRRTLELLAAGRADDEQTWQFIRVRAQEDKARAVRRRALELLVEGRAADEQTWHIIKVWAQEDEDEYIRQRALELLAVGRATDEQTWQFIRVRAQEDEDRNVRRRALELLAVGRAADEQTWQFIRVRAQTDPDNDRWYSFLNVRRRALELLAAGRAADEQTWQFIRVRAQEDEDEYVRQRAQTLLAKK